MSTRERDLTAFEDLDRVDRDRWSRAWAFAFIKSQPSEAIIAIATGGLDKFIAIARPILEGHAFQHEDFTRIYGFITVEAEKRARVRLH